METTIGRGAILAIASLCLAGCVNPWPRDSPMDPGGSDAAASFPGTMVLVAGGTFSMGERGVAEPVHEVTVSSFLISAYEVTQAQYRAVMSTEPAYFTGDPSRPVEQVSWYDALEFCNALSELAGLETCYQQSGYLDWSCDFTKDGYRLPTEAEWEFAARGGNGSMGYACCGSDAAADVAWYGDNSDETTHPVGAKGPNELGIYDMSGNVCEWCWDWFGNYGAGSETDPTGPQSSSGSYRVLRGGAWYGDAGSVRSCSRGFRDGDLEFDASGFRVARRPAPQVAMDTAAGGTFPTAESGVGPDRRHAWPPRPLVLRR